MPTVDDRRPALAMATNTTPTNTTRTGLLDLSPELRNKIYDMGLVHSRPIILELSRPRKGKWSRHLVIDCGQKGVFSLQILTVCRQIYNEAITIFYGKNTFRFLDNDWLETFLQGQIPNMVCHLRYVEIMFHSARACVSYSLRDAKHLKALRIGHSAVKNAMDIATELKPLAEMLYYDQEQKSKQKVLATFSFGEHRGTWLENDLEKTEKSMQLEAAVHKHLDEMLPHGETMLVKLSVKPEKLEVFWRVQELVEKYPGIRKALGNGLPTTTEGDEDDSDSEDEGEEGSQLEGDEHDPDDESGTEEDSSEDESSSDEESDDGETG